MKLLFQFEQTGEDRPVLIVLQDSQYAWINFFHSRHGGIVAAF